jgi:hypothetical protein
MEARLGPWKSTLKVWKLTSERRRLTLEPYSLTLKPYRLTLKTWRLAKSHWGTPGVMEVHLSAKEKKTRYLVLGSILRELWRSHWRQEARGAMEDLSGAQEVKPPFVQGLSM